MGEGRQRCPRAIWDRGAEGVQTHIQTSITHVTEEQFFFVKLERTLTYLALGILGGGAAMGVGEGWYGPGAGGG